MLVTKKKAVALLATAALTFSIIMPAYASSYTVKAGDSLFTIGKKLNSSVDLIKKANQLSSDRILPGQVLNIQAKTSTSTVVPATYTTKKGDSLFLIAKKFRVSLNSLRTINNKWDDIIYPNQTLKLSQTIATSDTSTSSTSSTSTSVIPYTTEDLDLMARLITAEAQGEPYAAQVAVGSVVINRVKSPDFANSIKSVINEKSNGYFQFTPVENGWINNPATEQAKKAALESLNSADQTKGALFYFDESTTSKYLWAKTISIRIGHMVYSF